MDNHLHSISTVSRLTGINAITLRAWERRYGLIQPKRTESGHRLFTDDDIVLIKEILFWVEKGISISKVPQYLRGKKTISHAGDNPDYHDYQQQAVKAVKNFDQKSLENYIDMIFDLYPLDVVSQKIYPKVLEALNEHWLTSDTAFSEQQFFSFYLRNKIASSFLQNKHKNIHGKLIVTTLQEAFSELELLFLAAALSRYGFEIILLGNRTLPQEWPKIIERTKAMGLIISITSAPSQLNQLKILSEYVKVPICVRTRDAVKSDERREDLKKLVWLPENYHLLLAKINEMFNP